jgi:hypothetical protein
MITNVYIHIAEFSLMLSKSRIWGKGKEHEKQGKRAIKQAAMMCIIFGCILYGISMVVVRILSNPLDSRANSMVVGFSQIFAGVVFCMLSVSVPQWFGMYHSNKEHQKSYTSERGVRFRLTWILWKQLLSMYFFNLYFSCADVGFSVLWGVLLGIVIGSLLVFLAIRIRSPKFEAHKKKLTMIMLVLLAIASWACIFIGIWYILGVWSPDENSQDGTVYVVSFGYSCIWIVMLIIVHVAIRKWSKKKQEMGKSTRFRPTIFQTPDSLFVAEEAQAELETSTREFAAAATKEVDTERTTNETQRNEEEKKNGGGGVDGGDGGGSEEKPKVMFAAGVDQVQAVDNEEVSASTRKSPSTTKWAAEKKKHCGYVSPEEAPSYWNMFMTELADTFPFFCCCLKKKYVENISRRRLDYTKAEAEKSPVEKVFICLKRGLWYFLSLILFVLTIVNIGASWEQCAARNQLGPTFELLYPPDYDTGTMCAWDAPGPNATIKTFDTLKEVEDEGYLVIHCGACGNCSNWNDIGLQYTTTKVLAGITKVCAKKSIGIKVNVTDPDDPVVKCNTDQVGFTEPCGMAWAWDEINTKDHAIFTFMQAMLSNAVADMKVAYTDITSATIDEAISGPYFVPDVGATRRRMDIKSDIVRPKNQQCKVIKQNWTDIFPAPDEFNPPVGGTYSIQLPGKPAETVVVKGQDDHSAGSDTSLAMNKLVLVLLCFINFLLAVFCC